MSPEPPETTTYEPDEDGGANLRALNTPAGSTTPLPALPTPAAGTRRITTGLTQTTPIDASGSLQRPSTSSLGMPAIGLADALQSLSQQHRTGTLTTGAGLALVLDQGQLVAVGRLAPGLALAALGWTGAVAPGDVPGLAQEGEDDAATLRRLANTGLLTSEAIGDALACLVQEEFSRLVLLQETDWDFVPERLEEPLVELQCQILEPSSVGGMLMEGMRRRDEQERLGIHLPHDWDLAVPIDNLAPPADPVEAELLARCNGHRPVWRLAETYPAPPWVVVSHLGQLHESGHLRWAESHELVFAADAARAEGEGFLAEGLYARADELGETVPRVTVALAELLADRGDAPAAAACFLRAGEDLAASDPAAAAAAYHSALAQGADRVEVLQRLYDLHRLTAHQDEAVVCGWDLVDALRLAHRLGEAGQVVAELARMGADRIRCLKAEGEIATGLGDLDTALARWDTLERLGLEIADDGVLALARERLLGIDPGRLDTALAHSQALLEREERDQAAMTLRAALDSAGEGANQDLVIRCRELLARCHPHDADNRRWLASAYALRDDRAGAMEQLRQLVVTQASSDDRAGLRESLQRLLELDPGDAVSARHLAAIHHDEGLVVAAEGVWQEVVQAAMRRGQSDQARDLLSEAMGAHPYALSLRLLAVRCANRLGRRDEAVRHCVAAARLARMAGDGRLAIQCLQQMIPIRPDDLALHAELVTVAEETDGTNLVGILDDAVAAAMETGNMGLAIGWSLQRIALLGDDTLAERRRLLHCYHLARETLAAITLGRELFDELIAAKRLSEAQVLLEDLVERYPQAGDLLQRLARFYKDRGDRQAAIETYRRAITLLQQEGRGKDAIRVLREFAPLYPDREALAKIKRCLEQGVAVVWPTFSSTASGGEIRIR